MARMPGATWTPTPNQSSGRRDYAWLNVHGTYGSYAGSLSWLRNPASNTSSTFLVSKTGHIDQLMDSTAVPWTNLDANPRSITVEFETLAGEPLTAEQLEAGAVIAEWVYRTHGTPLVVVTDPRSQHGVAYHGLGDRFGLNWGHPACPGPKIVAQIPAMVARARVIAGRTTPAQEETELNTQQAKQLANAEAAVLLGGPSMPDAGKSIGQSVKDIKDQIATTNDKLDALTEQVAALAALIPGAKA